MGHWRHRPQRLVFDIRSCSTFPPSPAHSDRRVFYCARWLFLLFMYLYFKSVFFGTLILWNSYYVFFLFCKEMYKAFLYFSYFKIFVYQSLFSSGYPTPHMHHSLPSAYPGTLPDVYLIAKTFVLYTRFAYFLAPLFQKGLSGIGDCLVRMWEVRVFQPKYLMFAFVRTKARMAGCACEFKQKVTQHQGFSRSPSASKH